MATEDVVTEDFAAEVVATWLVMGIIELQLHLESVFDFSALVDEMIYVREAVIREGTLRVIAPGSSSSNRRCCDRRRCCYRSCRNMCCGGNHWGSTMRNRLSSRS